MAITINGTTGISGVDGSSATPALQGADTNTGISFGTDTVTINTGGVARVTTDSSGNVGIGTGTPATIIHAYGGAAGVRTMARVGNETQAIEVGVNASNIAVVNTVANGAIAFTRADTESARITSSGVLLIGATSTPTASVSGFLASPSGIITSSPSNTSITTYHTNYSSGNRFSAGFHLNSTLVGSIAHNGSTTTYSTSSDYRLKENIQPMQNALATVAQLKPCTYTWKSNGSGGQGFIAHELQAVAPDCVVGEKDAVDEDGNPVYQGVDTSFLVATLTAAIQELKAELDSVKAELATLKGAA